MKTFCIAEAAACHDGNLEKAYRLIDLASEIKADAVKFQYCSNPAKLAERRHAPEYLESYRLLNHPVWWHDELSARAFADHIEYMTTVYLAEDIPVIAPYVKRFKVASFESWDEKFVYAHMNYDKPVILSTGLGQYPLDEYSEEMEAWWLHCVSAYPTPLEDINLRLLWGWGDADNEEHSPYQGLSDHTKHLLTGAFAVCAGANIIEFHVRLHDTNPKNADYTVARTPEEARVYVENIRLAEVMLGTGVKRVMPSEQAMLKYKVGP